MASGDTLVVFHPDENEPPATNYATRDIRNQHVVLDFDMTTSESAVFSSIMPRQYGGGGITVYIHWSTTVTSGDVDWDVAFERIGDQQQDVDVDGFATVQSVDGTGMPANPGHVDIVSIAFTNSEIDGILVGEKFRMKITRDIADTAAADIELHMLELKET
jgi:hypothetical protein